ncbi:MAG: Asp23/Gls24 family envelope stress response protein [Clostridiales bacterium]|nr:Asp23/Gls24 family envelope stress response protein [Clostridiales bacterium]
MAPKKENLPLTTSPEGEPTGTITYANEVVAVIAGVAANEVEGVAGMCTASTGIADVFSRNKNITKGVKVEVGTEEVSVDLYLNVEYGTPIQTAATNVQESVRKSIETMTGLHVVRVDVHVQGLSFEKEKKDNLVGLESFEGQPAEKKDEAPVDQQPEVAQPVEQEAPVVEETYVPETVEAPVEEALEEVEDTAEVVFDEVTEAEQVEESAEETKQQTEE